MKKNRFDFKCWNCKRTYSLYKEITNQQKLIVPCPYCNEEAEVTLETYRKEIKSIYKGLSDGEQQPQEYEYQFPDVIPTHKPGEN